MSKIGLHDSEMDFMSGKTFPNYALMKISAYHKSIGDTVDWWYPLGNFDKVYSSKVFDFTPENPYLPPDTVKGGTGYGIYSVLPHEIEVMFPDYSIYPHCDYAIGYITRGCPNNCRWCVVPKKEGDIRPYRRWQELVRTDSRKLVLMDNNILACEYGIEQLESLIDSGYAIDLNQGMDARLVDERIASILARLKWIRCIRFSCDTTGQITAVENAVRLLEKHGIKPYKVFIYLLVTSDIDNAAKRVERLKKFKGLTIYAQAERNDRMGIIPDKRQLEFTQRYIYSGIYRSETWQEYCKKRNFYRKEAEMGKLNISAFDHRENSPAAMDNSPLQEAYKSVWGSSYEKIENIELGSITHYSGSDGSVQPFRMNEDKITQIMASAADIGIVTPLIVRRTEGNKYQIISGHHRYEAAKKLELLSVPCVVRRITDDEAFQIVTESNIQRDKMLPSEYGRIFTVYMDKREDIGITYKEIADKFGISSKTLYRYVNVAKLIPELQNYVDCEKILLAAADIISGFSPDNQLSVLEYLERPDSRKITPAIAKQFAEIVKNYDGDAVPVHEFSSLFIPKPKPKYKSSIYNNLSSRFDFEHSEKELDELAERLLAEYFSSNIV